MIRILLLDCDESLSKKLTKKGFEVNAGTMGYKNGKRNIPVALYEQDVIFYNPTNIPFALNAEKATNDKEELFIKGLINDTPEINVHNDVYAFLERGGIIVTFFNEIDKDNINTLRTENCIQSWIPKIPYSIPTNDRIINNTLNYEDKDHKPFYYLFKELKLKLPVKRKSEYPINFPRPYGRGIS